MNCKPGDLAVVVKATFTPEILGHIVVVVGDWNGPAVDRPNDGHCWEVKYPDGRPILTTFLGGGRDFFQTRPFLDSSLRPLRDNDGEDETLTWAGKPNAIPRKTSATEE